MNLAPEILNFLAQKREFSEIILAPKASPVERKERRLTKIMDVILTPEDIRDTLVSLRSNTSSSLGPLGREGFFSFGMPEVGRIRVTYITQRGSYVVSIIKVPYEIPDISSLVEDKAQVKKLIKDIVDLKGIVAIISKSHIVHSLFAYSLLKEICQNESKVIYILERPLTYLMRHSSSIVIQREVGVDTDSFEEGVEEALFVNPDIIYINDITIKEGIKAIKKLIDIPILTLLGVTVSDIKGLKKILSVFLEEEEKEIEGFLSKVIELHADEEGKISFREF